MRFLADMNLSPLTVAALNDAGWQVTRVSTVPDAVTERLSTVLPFSLDALEAGCAITVDDRTVRTRRLGQLAEDGE